MFLCDFGLGEKTRNHDFMMFMGVIHSFHAPPPKEPSLPNIGGLAISDSAMTNDLNNQLLAPAKIHNFLADGSVDARLKDVFFSQMIDITIPLGHDFPGNNVPS